MPARNEANLMPDAISEQRPHAHASRRKGRDAEATRTEILKAATLEFSEKGLFGARVDEIAARTATSKHMIYYYFGSKDGLYAAVLERAYTDFRSVEAAVDYNQLNPVEALSILVGKTFDAHVGNPHFIRILMSENLDSGRHAATINHHAQRKLVLETIQGILDRGVALGVFRKDIDPLHLHMSLSALSFYFVANRFTFGHAFAVDMAAPDVIAKQRDEIIETLLSRCRPASA